MDKSRAIFVSIMLDNETVPVGALWCHRRKGRESASFEYHKEWLENPGRFALEPALVLTEGQHYTDKALFGALGDSAPDRWGRTLIQHAKQSRNLSELDYLLGVDDETRQGALRFSENIEGPYLKETSASTNPPLVKLEELLSISEKVLENKETKEELKIILNPGSSLGGARPKAAVIDKNGTFAIAKFPKKDDSIDISSWEAVALTLAKNAGISVPEFRLENIIGKPVLILKRFDREGKNRIPFLSAMSMLGAQDNDNNYSFVDIAYMLRKHGAQPDKDCEELWRRTVFGLMISNTDNHLRNHGFLYNGKGWILSPAYDLNPNNMGSDFSVLLDTEAHNSLESAIELAGKFRLSDAQAKKVMDEVKSAVVNWRKVAQSFGISEYESGRMKTAFLV
ncbi:MAG: type II toxin-antitoxin system HipA family toxin [Treponema sp.]|nr:type II toxin-antitoxin system HipA family toxin [Treponema sp.]